MQPERRIFPLRVPSEGPEVVVPRSQPTKHESLSEYVRQKRENHDPPLSLKDVEARSARYGFKIDASYVSKIENGHKKNPGADALVGLHYGLDAPLLEIISVAAGKPLKESDAKDEQLLTIFHRLEEEDRELAIRLLRTVMRARGTVPAEVKRIKKTGRRVA